MPTSTRKRVRQDVDSPGSLSKTAFPKRPRMGDQTPSLPSSDRITSPITSRTSSSSSSSSSSGTSGNEGSHAPSRASDPIYRRRARARQPREEAEEDTSSDESTSPESASSDVDTDTDDDEDDKKTSETEEVVPRLLALRKPQIHRVDRQPDLLERVSSFLPRMKAANDNLQQAIAAGRGDDMRVDNAGERNEGRYIEMNLGLGVLEEKRSDDDSSSSSDESDSDSPGEQGQTSRESNVLGRLMRKESTSKPTIEEVNQ